MGFGGYSYNGGFRSTQGIDGRANYKKVHKTAQVAHVWAQQVNPDGRNSKGALYFKGRTIYSYNSGWPLASFIKPGLVLVNTEKFSVSTTGHLSDVRGALHGLPDTTCVSVDSCEVLRAFLVWSDVDLEAGVKALRAHLADRLKTALDSALNLRKSQAGSGYVGETWTRFPDSIERRVALVQSVVADANATLAKLESAPLDFDLQAATFAIETFWNEHNAPDKLAKRDKASAARAKRACIVKCKYALDVLTGKTRLNRGNWKAERVALETFKVYSPVLIATQPEKVWRPIIEALQVHLARKEINANFDNQNPEAARLVNARLWGTHTRKPITADQWLAGANGHFSQYEPTLIRRKGDKLETSRHAEAPFKHAVAIFQKAQECLHTGTTWQRNGKTMQAGIFQLERIGSDGMIRIGCHLIGFAEMQRLAVKEVPHLVKARYPLPAIIAA